MSDERSRLEVLTIRSATGNGTLERSNAASSHAEFLPTLMRTLPQELQDEIMSYILQALALKSNTSVLIDADYKPPALLHLSRATRAQAAHTFYSTSVFQFHRDWTCFDKGSSLGIALLWLRSLPPQHRQSIRTIEYHRMIKQPLWRDFVDHSQSASLAIVGKVHLELIDEGATVHPERLLINYFKYIDGGNTPSTWREVGNVEGLWKSAARMGVRSRQQARGR